MKRSSPTDPCPFGGPPKRGCLYMGRFLWILLLLIWGGVWILFWKHSLGHKLRIAGAASGIAFPVFIAPLFALAERLEIRRYCASRGFKILKLQWRGVVYMDGHAKRYSRWPEDFKVKTQG